MPAHKLSADPTSTTQKLQSCRSTAPALHASTRPQTLTSPPAATTHTEGACESWFVPPAIALRREHGRATAATAAGAWAGVLAIAVKLANTHLTGHIHSCNHRRCCLRAEILMLGGFMVPASTTPPATTACGSMICSTMSIEILLVRALWYWVSANPSAQF